jgi:hypothetical protein
VVPVVRAVPPLVGGVESVGGADKGCVVCVPPDDGDEGVVCWVWGEVESGLLTGGGDSGATGPTWGAGVPTAEGAVGAAAGGAGAVGAGAAGAEGAPERWPSATPMGITKARPTARPLAVT